jgi:iron-sulfur cluster assembly protein
MVTVTEMAARQILFSAEKMDSQGMSIRIAAKRGAKLEVQYQMGFDDRTDDDEVYESNGITVLVDETSAPLLEGLTLDYFFYDGSMQFVFLNPNDISEELPPPAAPSGGGGDWIPIKGPV